MLNFKDKMFAKRPDHPLPNPPFAGWPDKTCQFCKIMFCCKKCRDRHVDKEHPGKNADCSLCASKRLRLRTFEFAQLDPEDEKLLLHIIDNHLPLHCRYCGDVYKSRKDFETVVPCEKFEHKHTLTSPIDSEHLEKKLKSSISESNYYNSRYYTPPEIIRKTSTPMFGSQKIGCEISYVPEFSFKTPKTNSSSVAQITSISKIQTYSTQYFSYFSTLPNEEMTPFKTSKGQLLRSNSGRKLSIKEEEKKITYKEIEKFTNTVEKSSPAEVNLAICKGTILESPKSDDSYENEIKKIKFFDQHKTAEEEFGNLLECVRTIFNTTVEEELENTDDEIKEQKAKIVDAKDVKNTVKLMNLKDTFIAEDGKSANESKANNKQHYLEDALNNLQIVQDNTKTVKKENQDPEVSKEDVSNVNQRDVNRVLMMVLLEKNSGDSSDDVMPLINMGLKKLQEQLTSANFQLSPDATESTKVCRRSITTVKMTVDTYSLSSAETMMDNQQVTSSLSPSSLSVKSNENNKNSGFLSSIAQTMKNALRSFSGLRIPRSIETTELIQRRKIVEELTSSQESLSNNQVRPGKRSREVFLKENPFVLNTKSPLAKRQKRWYTMIRGREPINRMRSKRVITSPRGVSTETQIFSQGSLMVGDMILPLPARAHQSTE